MAVGSAEGVHVKGVSAGAIVYWAERIVLIREAGKVFVAPGGLINDILAYREIHILIPWCPKERSNNHRN